MSSINCRLFSQNTCYPLANCYHYLIRHRWRVLTITVVLKPAVVGTCSTHINPTLDIAITIGRVRTRESCPLSVVIQPLGIYKRAADSRAACGERPAVAKVYIDLCLRRTIKRKRCWYRCLYTRYNFTVRCGCRVTRRCCCNI